MSARAISGPIVTDHRVESGPPVASNHRLSSSPGPGSQSWADCFGYHVRVMPSIRIAALTAILSMASACGSAVPSAPSPPSSAPRLALACSTQTLLAGDVVVCMLRADAVNVSGAAAWASSAPGVATSEGIGLFVGKSDGQTTLTATFSGQTVSAPLTVQLQDVIRADAAAFQGSFKVGTIATMWLQGFYGVASGDSGSLTLVITDQTGATVSTSTPLTVARGGDRYLVMTTFALPPGTTRVCRTGVLQIGSTTLTVVPDVSLVPCVTVMP